MLGSPLGRAWRVIATGISFATFGAVGLVLGLIAFPSLDLLVRHPDRRVRAGRRVIAWTFRQFIYFMRGLGLLRYELRGFERLRRRGLLVLANHPSLIDTVFLLGFVPDCTCVVDDALFRNAFMARSLRAAGYIRNSEGADVFTHCTRALDAGTNLLIFPEGTRTPRDGTIRLRRGAANVAVRGARDITPVTIRCEPRTLTKGERWWQVPPVPPRFLLEVGEDVPVAPYIAGHESAALAVRELTRHLESYFRHVSVPHVAA